MGFVIALINGLRKFSQILQLLVKKAARIGKSVDSILKDPKVIIQILIESILNFVKTYVSNIVLVVLIVVLLIGLVTEGVRIVYDEIAQLVSMYETVAGWIYGDMIIEEINKITKEKAQEMIDDGSPYDPRNISLYIDVEQNTTPYKVDTKRKYKKTTWTENGEKESQRKIDYELSLIEVSYNYRLPWEFVLGLDVINETALKTNYFSKEIVRDAEKKLAPIYTWGYDKYSKDTTNINQTWQIKYEDNKQVYKKMIEEVKEYNSYPLPILDRVETMFKIYNYNINENEVTETNWAKSKPVVHEWTETEDNKTTKYKTITYHRYKTIVVEDKVNYVTETQTGEKLHNFLRKFGFVDSVEHEDATMLYEIISKFNNTEQLQEDLEDYIGLDYIVGGGTGNYLYTPLDIVIQPSEIEADVPYFSQKDRRWGNLSYGNSTIRRGGCGPTSMAMAISSLGRYSTTVDLNNDGIIDPYEAAKWSERNGYKAEYGTYWSFFAAIGKEVNIDVDQKRVLEWRDVVDALEKGKVVISSMKPGHFTRGGHFILLAGVSSDGKIIINDPNSKARSKRTWNFGRIILPQSKQFWIISD